MTLNTIHKEHHMDDQEIKRMRDRQEKIAVGGIFLGIALAGFVHQGMGALLFGLSAGFAIGRQ